MAWRRSLYRRNMAIEIEEAQGTETEIIYEEKN
jgi:hypothetical protein